MRLKGLITYSLLSLLCGVTLCGCSRDIVPDSEEMAQTVDYYLKLSLNTSTQTRAGAHPWGGETGDGTEEGHNHENDIDDITIFIYTDETGEGVNGDADTPIKYSRYFGGLMLSGITTYDTEPLLLRNYQVNEDDRIIVLANMGDKTGLTTLGAVRDAMVNTAWTSYGSSFRLYRHFAMSSAIDNDVSGILDFTPDGTYSSPFEAKVEIERVAARIDFWLYHGKAPAAEGEPVMYEAEDGSGYFYLSHVRIVNGSVAPTYALKRTATAVNPLSTTVTYLGDETVDGTSHIPTNYVVEPKTYLKHSGTTISLATLLSWYGESAMDNSLSPEFMSSPEYQIRGYAGDPELFSVTVNTDIDGDGSVEGNISCYTLGYVMENTMDKSALHLIYDTGLEFKGTFRPKRVYTWSGSTAVEDPSYDFGDDFWFYKNSTTPADSYAFSSETALLSYAEHHTDDYEVIHYENGVCYYYVWIRHSMFDSSHATGTFPMEYGIVRNNIYRIGVEKVLRLGTEIPDPEGDESLYSHLFVRDWRLRLQPEIVL